jgi:hypothetical protein
MSSVKKRFASTACLLALSQAGLLFLLGLASVNPDLHDALHSESGCPHHPHSHDDHSEDAPTPESACPVVLYGQGLTLGIVLELPERAEFARERIATQTVLTRVERRPLSQRSRAPPTVLLA